MPLWHGNTGCLNHADLSTANSGKAFTATAGAATRGHLHAGRFAVRLEVEAVIPPDDPSEPCYEPDVVEFIREVHERANAGDIEWLKTVGDVYVLAHSKSA